MLILKMSLCFQDSVSNFLFSFYLLKAKVSFFLFSVDLVLERLMEMSHDGVLHIDRRQMKRLKRLI